MNKEQKRYLKEIKALMPVYGKYEKRFFHDIKDSICELDAEHITYEMLCRKLGRPEDLIVNYYQEIDSTYLRKQLKRTRSIKAVVLIIVCWQSQYPYAASDFSTACIWTEKTLSSPTNWL